MISSSCERMSLLESLELARSFLSPGDRGVSEGDFSASRFRTPGKRDSSEGCAARKGANWLAGLKGRGNECAEKGGGRCEEGTYGTGWWSEYGVICPAGLAQQTRLQAPAHS
jgi:hypothetical protein